ESLGGIALDADRGLRPPHEARRFGRPEAPLQRIADGNEIVGGAGHDMLGGSTHDIVGTGFQRGLEHRIAIGRAGAIDHLAAARNRGLAAGSGSPVRAAVVNSRMILVKILARRLSWAPLRCMMFLNCE